MAHVDIKKLGCIPAGGGWRIQGVGTEAVRASQRTGPVGVVPGQLQRLAVGDRPLSSVASPCVDG